MKLFSIVLAATAAAGLVAFSQMAQGQEAPAAAAAAPASDEAAVASLVDETCTKCHDFSMIPNNPQDAAGWADTVQTMRDRGAALDDTQAKAVVAYLAKTYPAK